MWKDDRINFSWILRDFIFLTVSHKGCGKEGKFASWYDLYPVGGVAVVWGVWAHRMSSLMVCFSACLFQLLAGPSSLAISALCLKEGWPTSTTSSDTRRSPTTAPPSRWTATSAWWSPSTGSPCSPRYGRAWRQGLLFSGRAAGQQWGFPSGTLSWPLTCQTRAARWGHLLGVWPGKALWGDPVQVCAFDTDPGKVKWDKPSRKRRTFGCLSNLGY